MKAVTIVLLLLMCIGCSPRYPFLVPATHGQASALRAYGTEAGLVSPEFVQADSLFAAGTALFKKGDEARAYPVLERSVILYRLALSRLEAEKSRADLQQVEQRLSAAEERLVEYRRILKEVQAVRSK